MSDTRPQRVTTLTLGDRQYDLAKNGRFTLAETDREDFYGNPVYEEVTVTDLADDLIQELGRVTLELQAARAALARTEVS